MAARQRRAAELIQLTQEAQAPYVEWKLYNDKDELIRTVQQPAPLLANGVWGKLRFVITPDLSSQESRNGYLVVQLRNGGSNPTYYDSLTVRFPQDRALVSQENHYYPFGMNLSGVAVNTAPVSTLSKEQFNDGSTLEDELLGADAGVYSTFFRTYDPTIGRFQGVDIFSDNYVAWSPYQFGLCNPTSFNDPTGALTQSEWQGILNQLFDMLQNSDVVGASWSADGGGGSNGFSTIKVGDGGSLETYVNTEGRDLIRDNNGQYYSIPNGWTSQVNTGTYDAPKIVDSHNVGNNFLIGWEGEGSLGLQAEANLFQTLKIDVDVASVVLADFKLQNRYIEGSSFSTDNYKVKQGIGGAAILSASYKHSFTVVNGDDTNHEREFRFGLSFIGATITWNGDGDIRNVFIGLDPGVGGAVGIGGEIKYKIGYLYVSGK